MAQGKAIRYLLLAGLALAVGFLALAIAVPMDQQNGTAQTVFFSPGLKLAQLITPDAGKSMAWTFSWFLRIAIVTNAAFYFAIFSLVAYIVGKRRAS